LPVLLYGWNPSSDCIVCRMTILDTSGLWSTGDEYRVVRALSVPFSEYTQDCVITCMNSLQLISINAQEDVLALLVDWEAADTAQSAQNLSNTEGKTLVEADVLKWQASNNGVTGPQSEKQRVRMELRNIFAFCTCLAPYLGDDMMTTPLVRS